MHEFDTLFTLRTYSAQLWKTPFLREFLDEPDSPLDIQVPHPPGMSRKIMAGRKKDHQIMEVAGDE